MTRALLDACVLFPSVTREILMRAARAGFFIPLWSPRILEEWRRAARRHGEVAQQVASGEIALLGAFWPAACIEVKCDTPDPIWLPDPDDVHVLQAAITGGADELVTANRKDFPIRILAAHGIIRRDPDTFLLEFAQADPAQMLMIAQEVLNVANQMSGSAHSLRNLLKKARLPRLGKFLAHTDPASIAAG